MRLDPETRRRFEEHVAHSPAHRLTLTVGYAIGEAVGHDPVLEAIGVVGFALAMLLLEDPALTQRAQRRLIQEGGTSFAIIKGPHLEELLDQLRGIILLGLGEDS